MFSCTEELTRYSPQDRLRRHSLSLRAERGARIAADESRIGNGLLRALDGAVLEEVMPYLERVPLKRRQVLHERNLPVMYAYFIEQGLASLMARADDQCMLEVGTLGREDFVGLPVVLGTTRTPHRCVVQVPGEAWRISADDLQALLNRIPALRQLLLTYVQATNVQSAQLVVCNSRHSLRQRLARWLLFAHDQVEGNEIALTHQFLGRALGVRRAGVTTAMGRLEEAGMILRGRGRIVILDRARLEGEVCDCYRAIRSEYKKITCDSGSEPAYRIAC
ncbi:Crp/Fnr family transcriptional regulator [Microvirga splendida]|uniref:Crp/Fnr family transcriptional regulator n=1 Tax=Microvirga splendida TaxID=2795727 RepID=A0ABS0Y3Z9_9HYPH|nr:Crp/Fnr family transcriptional regulator [Microvirga splendida]MBJ6126994.1 Crp/Fnr family transcriptional regulator [Microvirga splendida]